MRARTKRQQQITRKTKEENAISTELSSRRPFLGPFAPMYICVVVGVLVWVGGDPRERLGDSGWMSGCKGRPSLGPSEVMVVTLWLADHQIVLGMDRRSASDRRRLLELYIYTIGSDTWGRATCVGAEVEVWGR